MNQYRSGEYRPCTVYGVKCMFHRWIEEEKLILKIESCIRRRSEYLEVALRDYNENCIVGPGMSTEKVKQTFALVEFANGQVEKVDPTVVIFDKEKKVEDMSE